MKNQSSVIYQLDGKPKLTEAIPLGLQHILAMFVGNVTPLIIISNILNLSLADKTSLIQCAMFVSGIVTLIQCYKVGPFGARLPIVMGTSFGFVPVLTAIGAKYGYETILGACLVGGLIEVMFGQSMKKLRRFFSSVVTGTVVLAMGISLLPTGINYFAGGVGASDFGSISNLILGTVVLLTVLIFNQYTKGITSLASILIGLIVGYIVAIPMGKIDFSQLSQMSMISVPMPFTFGFEFHLDAIFAVACVFIVSAVETVGDITSIAHSGIGRDATDKEIAGGVMADGIGSVIGAMFSVLPNTSFGQNVGIIAMTKVINRNVVATGAVFLILAAVFPKFGAIISLMPSSVLGGASVMMFAMIAVSGIKLITSEPLNNRNSTIVALSLGVGVGLSFVPGVLSNMPESIQLIFGDSGLVLVAIIAVVLNIVLPKEEKSVELEVKLEGQIS
ncbi:nucleobase:cation symporter-2 family protein [Romboutsia sp. 1001216sp1]|uniref:uracil-xanthine permease family protein n=1 Tax=unclassified Romboutsia TaxID=2626894 RepID=UPI00189E1806|nr:MULTISPECIES: nucleobase:cation symporter-2 family protein [unclassified Romboutsia]MDB8800958.1 nucleobase:cation symporter-2 family protein [Romboutsia sp. 1001216sp1]MDB8812357.1 nucleobase:cation symporter-2 family protein [Romboutsia sp. 1001216sp1]